MDADGKLCEYTYSDKSKFLKHVRKTLGIKSICPLTGSDDISGRSEFWNYILSKKLDPNNLDYECINNEGELNVDNINKLIGIFSYLIITKIINIVSGKKETSLRIRIFN